MPNPYPIEIADAGDGNVKVAGKATFTDAANQPGSLPLARNVGQAAYTFAAAGNGAVPLVFDSGDAGLVDLSTATYPKVIAAGVYSYILLVHNSIGAAQWSADLLVDDNWYSIHAKVGQLGTDAWVDQVVSVVWWCDANDPFAVTLGLQGADTLDGTVYVQRITA